METIIGAILAYLISLAAGLRGGAILEKEKQAFKKKLDKEAEALQAIQDRRSLREQLRLVGTEAARITAKAKVTDAEKPLFMLLTDEVFQEDMAKWLTAWRPENKKEAEAVLTEQMVKALQRGGVDDKNIEQFKSGYFDRIEKVVFSDPVLANWRLTLALNTAFERLDELEAIVREEGLETRHEVQEQHKETRKQVEEMTAKEAHRLLERFSEEKRQQAVNHYRELALESCDIIDLANLPEGDRHIATRQLELRRLYVPLRVEAIITRSVELDEGHLKKTEELWAQFLFQKGGRISKMFRLSIGELLEKTGRLVLLGDPGAGKTTLIRWIATAYLLRLKQDSAYKDLPDVATLPDKDWLPIVIRCRDLDESCKTGSIDDVLCETFRKAQMSVEETAALQAVIREMLVQGKAILMVDGLDEISNIGIRARFSQQIERLHIAFPNAPMIVTSRIVGYREMKYRIGRGFEHATVSEFIKEEKDEFARRWCDITELPERREKAAEELMQAIHSSDRIERLAGNPMLLTTLALVKRKVGKLPKRRADLYWEAVLVLLNWRSEVDDPIDHREAIPQLEYVAYEMCRQGVQRLREDEILELMEKMREEYPNVRAAKRHEPEEFLRMLERRTGILIEAGEVRHKGRLVPVFEFRHLTFQEYLAALALVDSKFPGRDSSKSLAEHIAPLAGQAELIQLDQFTKKKEAVVKDNWREALRLCAACCGDNDVDDVLMAILTLLPGEKPEETARPRAVLAASCLADEPNVSDEVAHNIIFKFPLQVQDIDEYDTETTFNSAVMQLAGTEWEQILISALVEEFFERTLLVQSIIGRIIGRIGAYSVPKDDEKFQKWFQNIVKKLNSDDNKESIIVAFTLGEIEGDIALRVESNFIYKIVDKLLAMIEKKGPSSYAGAWALIVIADTGKWLPGHNDTKRLISAISDQLTDINAISWIISTFELFTIISKTNELQEIGMIISKLDEVCGCVNNGGIDSFFNIKDPKIIELLIPKRSNQNVNVREIALHTLSNIYKSMMDLKLLSTGQSRRLDPRETIDEKRVKEAAKELKMQEAEVRQRYERLAEKYKLKLSWRAQ